MDHQGHPTKANSSDGNACAAVHMQNNNNSSLRELIAGTIGGQTGFCSTNKSCDRCTAVKRRCDGNGMSQCRYVPNRNAVPHELDGGPSLILSCLKFLQ